MTPRGIDGALIDDLLHDIGADEIEVFLKRGRLRRFVRERERETQAEMDEQGWAVRATTSRASFFCCGTGEVEGHREWPEPDGYPLRLPGPSDLTGWQAAPRSEAPLASESELRAVARGMAAELETVLPGSRLELLALEDGQSESRIGNSKGVVSGWRTRVASLALEASRDGQAGATARAEWLLGELREISPRRLVGRLADLLAVESEGKPISRDRCEVVAAPEVATALLAGLTPLISETTSSEIVHGLGGPDKLASSLLTLIDDGRLSGGVLASPVDGEGTPTQEVALIEEGMFRQPLLPWWADRPGARTGGCSRRDSWREQPRVGPSHLYLRPDVGVRAAELVASLSRGYYLLDAPGSGSFDFSADRFELPTRGFELVGGRARMPVAGVLLVGRISALLRGLRGAARDLTFVSQPIGVVGSPTVLFAGLELRGRA